MNGRKAELEDIGTFRRNGEKEEVEKEMEIEEAEHEKR